MMISQFSAIICSLFAGLACASIARDVYRAKDGLMLSCLNGDPSLFEHSLRTLISNTGKESVCHPYSWFVSFSGNEYSCSFELQELSGKTFYSALLRGLYLAGDKPRRREDVRKIMATMISKGILGCPGNYIIKDIIEQGLGFDLALKALRAGASPLSRSGSVLDYNAFRGLDDGQQGAFEFIKEVVAHPEMQAVLAMAMNPLYDFGMYYHGTPEDREVLQLLISNGARISFKVMQMWAYHSFPTFVTYHDGFSDFVHAVPNPYVVAGGKGFQDAIEEAYAKVREIGLSEYPTDDPQFAIYEERKAKCYEALIHARAKMPAILNPEGRFVTLRFKLPATRVFVTGTFDSWKQTIEMTRDENDGSFYKEFLLDNDMVYQFKFVADGNWIATDDYPKSDDGQGNVSNVI